MEIKAKNTKGKKDSPEYKVDTKDPQMMVYDVNVAYHRKINTPINFGILRKANPKSNIVTTALGITEKTYKVYISKGKELSPLQSEWVLAYKELLEFGSALFGNFHRFESWLSVNSERLHAIPNDLITTVTGIQEIKKELSKIAEGYPA